MNKLISTIRLLISLSVLSSSIALANPTYYIKQGVIGMVAPIPADYVSEGGIKYNLITSFSAHNNSSDSNPGWRNISYSCKKQPSGTNQLFYHGFYTCQSDLMNGGGSKFLFDLRPSYRYEISFSVRKYNYGSNYYSALAVSGITT